MDNNLPGIEFKKDSNITIDSDASLFEIPFYKDIEYFSNFDNYVYFIKAVEKTVRGSDYYKQYKKELIETYGLSYCQVLSNIDSESASIDMHHGPILNLFDYVAIILDYMLANGKGVTTFDVANEVLQAHFDNLVQVVMLSKTVHEEVHENDIFLNYKHAIGDLNSFIKKYYDGFGNEHIIKINRYIARSMKNDSYDKDVLKLQKNILSWAKK